MHHAQAQKRGLRMEFRTKGQLEIAFETADVLKLFMARVGEEISLIESDTFLVRTRAAGAPPDLEGGGG